MQNTYNLYNLEASFKEYLLAGNAQPVSVKNYLSDYRHFFGWLNLYTKSNTPFQQSVSTNFNEFQYISAICKQTILDYKSYLIDNSLPIKTINRRLSTVRKFCSFCISQGWMKENVAKHIPNVTQNNAENYAEQRGKLQLLEEFKNDLKKDFGKTQLINSYLEDVKEFLSI
jgi:site-specific recombinase XerD